LFHHLIFLSWFYDDTNKNGLSVEGSITSYPSTGYAILLGRNADESKEKMRDLKANKWIDRNTRAVTIDFAMYNGNINTFYQIK
jgi:hypothetical protein